MAQALQDWAFLKLQTDNYDDALLHLQSVENHLKSVKPSEIDARLYGAFKRRQKILIKRSQNERQPFQEYLEIEKKLEKLPDANESVKEAKKASNVFKARMSKQELKEEEKKK